ncbi:GntR family transcriptional regulator [Actinopolymorpha cephalotaxi]|uniref:GntR family transcriptional regulator n=1 Tax=Actinopolymorpha cephalotaxi TaxID=504797 RepID=A0A1I2XR35_9ACTN|nr:GntR family transcriptional regulator [Actinopolymorpha cephalotaxi]NYH87141.1 GntR family transcriptional regulator [Actinopolymorpha cephalotaxi]SFH15910.1 GntR family transcriptional regulator [Actinopolymorpha cephalotaxi]
MADAERTEPGGGTVAKYATVRAHLLDLIRDRLEPHERLPTERQLCADLGVSRLTVRRAVEQLVGEGVVYRIQGSGTYVAEPSIRKRELLSSFSDDMRTRGLAPGAKLLRAEQVVAGAREGWRLGVSPGEPLVHLVRLRLANAVPMCLEDVWLVAGLVPDLLDSPVEGSLYETLLARYRITLDRAEQEVRATVVDREQAALLEVPALTPALLVERVTYDVRGRAVELARSLYRGDRYSLEQTLRRQ